MCHPALSLHSSNEPGELYNGYGHNDSTINIDSGVVILVVVVAVVVVIIIMIIILFASVMEKIMIRT